MISIDRSSGETYQTLAVAKSTNFVPLFLSASMIIGIGIATATTANSNTQGASQQVPQKGEKPQEPTKQVPPPKPVPNVGEIVPGITFANQVGIIYVQARTLATRLGLEVVLDPTEKWVMIGDKKFDVTRRLFAGDVLIPIREIAKFDGTIEVKAEDGDLTVQGNGCKFDVVVGQKRIEVDKAAQELTAFQGEIVVIKTNISTGRPGHNTPNGEFSTGSKERMHYSHKYNDAEMPYAVEVNGDVFFHGYGSVPHYPASHGCIRIPLGRKNPAKYLYNWVNRGVDVTISGAYDWNAHTTRHRHRRKKK